MQLRNAVFVKWNRLAKVFAKNTRNSCHVSSAIETADFTALYMVNCASCRVATVEVNRTECKVAFYSLVSRIVVFRESAVEKFSGEKLKSLFITLK